MAHEIIGLNSGRILVVSEDDTMRKRYYDIVGEDKLRIKFKRVGNNLMAKVGEEVAVYRKPNANSYHKTLMRENGLALYRGLSGCDSDMLMENMLEFVEII